MPLSRLPTFSKPVGSSRPAKRPRDESDSKNDENNQPSMPPRKRPPIGDPKLKRSTSVTSLSGSSSGRIGLRKPALAGPAGRQTLHPATNTINRPALASTRRATLRTRTPLGPTDSSVGAKKKRPAWDLQGRLVDMEKQLELTNNKVADYDARMSSLEMENTTLTTNLQSTSSNKQVLAEEVAKYEKQLSETSSIKMKLELQVTELEDKTSMQEAQIKSLRSNLARKTEEAELLSVERQDLSEKFETTSKKLAETSAALEKANKLIEEQNQKLIEGETQRRKLHNDVQELKGNIRVFCRVRPLIGEELNKTGNSMDSFSFLDDRSLEIAKKADQDTGRRVKGNNHSFSFDKIFPPFTTQMDVFNEVSQVVQSALDGFKVCIFAYGQTGSGKTFTMEGDYANPECKGMIPRTVEKIFSEVQQLETKEWKYEVKASFMEIYNENIRDLLVSPKEAKNTSYEIKMIEGKSSEVFVKNLKVVTVETFEEVMNLLTVAQEHRAVAATNCNERSSRSHSIFKLQLTGSNSNTKEICEGELNLVDLAGSERLKDSLAEGARLTETQSINKSLSTLGNVIMALAQNQSHIPYRNSKLTHILQNSLGGNSKTLMFVNVSPVPASLNETLSSLRFATKVNQCQIGTATMTKKFSNPLRS